MYWDNIDWSATGAWMQAWAGFAGAGVVLLAAREGFQTWVRQRQRERKIAAAERILTFVYQVKEIFPAIRSPATMGPELVAAEAKLRENYEGYGHLKDTEKRRLQLGQSYLTRLSSNADLWKELWNCLPLARAFFGPSFEEKVRGVWLQRAHIHTAAQMYATVDPERDKELVDQFETDLWEGWGDANGKGDRIAKAIAELVECSEALLIPVISEENWIKPRRK